MSTSGWVPTLVFSAFCDARKLWRKSAATKRRPATSKTLGVFGCCHGGLSFARIRGQGS